tara:strand:- start:72 stop:380 length:309 start_codon:yes stop_codon:yes gene_type:complete
MGKGMKHYTEDGLYTGETHKMDDGSLHTGKTHTKTSKVVSHKKGGPFKMKGYNYPGTSPIEKKVSWKYGEGTYSGELIPSKETSTHRYARTHNGKIKSLPKN